MNFGKISNIASTINSIGSKATNFGDLATKAQSIGKNIDIKNLSSGINLSGVSINNLDGFKGVIEGKMEGMTSNLTSQLESSMSSGDIESMINTSDFESQLTSLANGDNFDMKFDESEIKSILGTSGLDGISFL